MRLSEFEAGRIKSNMPIYAQQKKTKKRNKQTNIKKKHFVSVVTLNIKNGE
jgi:hypothetical protein